MSSTPLLALIARCRVLCRPRTHGSDAELLARFVQQRDAAAFEELLQRHAPLVWGVCRRIVPNEADCEDAFQAVFLALVRQAAWLDGRGPLGAWLHTVAVRVARKVSIQTRRQRSPEALPERATCGDVADEVSSRELFRLVDEEIERLPARLRVPIVLCCLQGRTRDEAAETLGCSLAAVRSRLERGRHLLRRRLARRGVELPVAFLALGLTSERIRAGLWAKTLLTVRYTPAPEIAALAEATLPGLMIGKGKLALVLLLLATGMGGVLGSVLISTSPSSPAAPPPAKAAAEPKKPETPRVRTDRHGDPLPDGAIARLGTVRWRPGIFVQTLAYSPDGKMIVSSGGRALILWDAATGKEIRRFPISNGGQLRGVAFSPDGKLFANTGRTAQLWDIASGKMLRELKNVRSRAIALAFSPDGKLLASGYLDGTLSLEDVAGGDEKRRIDSGQGRVNTVAFAPDGKLLASGGSDGTIRLWDAAAGKEVHRMTAPKKELSSVVFSPDGKLLASGSNEDSLRLWDVATGRQIRTLGEKKRVFTAIAFSPDGKLLASGHLDGTLSLWDTVNGEQKRHWQAALDGCSLAFCPDGKTLATVGRMGSVVRLWDLRTGKERYPSEGHHAPVSLLRFAPDKRTLISAGGDQRMVWWDLATQTPSRQFEWTTYSFIGFALSPNGNTLAADDFKTHELWLWDVHTGKSTRLPGKHPDLILAIAFSPDGRLLASAGERDQPIRIWDVQQGKEVRQIKGFTNRVTALRFSPDGKTLACGTSSRRNAPKEPTLRLWDVSSGKERCTFDSHNTIDFALAFSPDGKVLAGGDTYGGPDEALVRLWDTTTGKELCRHAGHQQMIGAVAFSPDGKLVASGTGRTQDFANSSVHVWEAATGRLIRCFEGHHSWVWAVTFAADGLTLASGAGDSTILLWDITGRHPDGRWHTKPLTQRQLDVCWTALANEDAAKAYDAVWALVAAPEQALPLLRKHLSPAPRPDPKIVAQLIADLESEEFRKREKATEELTKLGDAAAPALRQALEDKPALEMRRRLQQLLDQSRDWTPERLREHRAIQALEHIGTRQARDVLQALAEGAPSAERTEAAKAVLQRLAR